MAPDVLTRQFVDPHRIGSVHYIQADITTVKYGVVAHGVNCQGKMASGVAKYIRAKWPIVYDEYLAFIDERGLGKNVLGLANIVQINEGLYVANCFSQEHYGYNGKTYATVDAIKQSLISAMDFAHANDLIFYMPKIGSGLGGLDWFKEVLPMVWYLAADYAVEVVVCEYEP